MRRAAAPQPELEALLSTLPAPVPDDFARLYRENDGEAGDLPMGLFFGYRFLCLDEITRLRVEWAEELAAGYIEQQPPADPRIGEEFPSLSHLPVFGDGDGNFIGLDLAPGAGGTPGQVLYFGADLLESVWACASLEVLIEGARDALLQGTVDMRRDPRTSPRPWIALRATPPAPLRFLRRRSS